MGARSPVGLEPGAEREVKVDHLPRLMHQWPDRDLRAAAKVVEGVTADRARHGGAGLRPVKHQAEAEGWT